MIRSSFRACQAKVFQVVASTMLLWNDVFDMKREEIEIVLMYSAILAMIFSTLPNEQPDR